MLSAQDIKDKLNIDDVCAVIESLGGTYKGKDSSGSTLYYTSISHNKDADDSSHKSRLNVHSDDLTMTDYVLALTFDIFELVRRRKELFGIKYSFPQCIKYVCDIVGIDYDSVETPNENIYNWSKLKHYLKREKGEVELKEYDKSILSIFDSIYHQSWINEGFTPDILDKWNIKWYNYKQQIIIPVFDNKGILRGIRSRNVIPEIVEEYGKYIPTRILNGTQFNFPSSQILFGENYNFENIKNKKMAVLVEAEKSVIKSDMWFNHSCAVAMFGHNLSDYNLKRLIELGVNDLTIGIDFDFENKNTDKYKLYCDNVNKIYDKCSPYFKVYVLTYPKENNKYIKYSPFDFNKEQYLWMWEHRERIE